MTDDDDDDDKKDRFILFASSFVMKPNYILRTLPPRLTTEFVTAFERIKKRIICSLLDIGIDLLPSLTYDICNFAVKKGGLGLSNLPDVAHAAYVSSLIDYHKHHDDCIDINDPNPYTEEFIQAAAIFVNAPENNLRLKKDLNMVALLSLDKKESETYQHVLTEELLERKWIQLKDTLRENNVHHFKWWNHHQNSEAGKWLECLPISTQFHMPNDVFEAALRLRLFYNASGWSPNKKCICKSTKGNGRYPNLDSKGHHLAFTCSL